MYRIYKHSFFQKCSISNFNFACLLVHEGTKKIGLKVEGSYFANLSEDGTQAKRHSEIKPPLTKGAKASQDIILGNF